MGESLHTNKSVWCPPKTSINPKQEKVLNLLYEGQLPVLNNHKKWLKSFKEKIDNDKKVQ